MTGGAQGRAADGLLLGGGPCLWNGVRSPVPVRGGQTPDPVLLAAGVDDGVHLLQLLDGPGEEQQGGLVQGGLVQGVSTFAEEVLSCSPGSLGGEESSRDSFTHSSWSITGETFQALPVMLLGPLHTSQ